jgi:hypothetical protein
LRILARYPPVIVPAAFADFHLVLQIYIRYISIYDLNWKSKMPNEVYHHGTFNLNENGRISLHCCLSCGDNSIRPAEGSGLGKRQKDVLRPAA